jgi:hypothetical protein
VADEAARLARRPIYDHLAFLLAAADLCQHEPAYYGTLRLLDGASRFARALLEGGYEDPALVPLLDRIEEAKCMRKADSAAYSELLRELPAEVAEVIRTIGDEAAR